MKSAVISVGGNDYQVIFHRDKANAKAPTMVYVNQVGNSSIGAYVYTIGKGTETYTSVLQQGESMTIQDLAANLGRVLTRRFAAPSYVCMSGSLSMYDYGEVSSFVVAQCM
ncbi:hypothetical protein EJF18_11100 [Clavispora lusitaniae]|uniref:Uncharacterized protein n=3 Tax=Clavispora lusitaniae TaxID=36911 RepID=C4XYP9_CLAL4|nr:uncharacterized protein CLUG_01072 [Clavispora lusitaniae ATCC 42720]KAF5212619.1 hypothetical protein E0198_000115 [Clavispora lusitaniae]EEQ36949.1 predicted protein [Clavispora lusitaniae ATCC 42720]KAF7584937.1 20S proteasome chaperone family protein [Clavispora lusitaniae]OVF08193.1 hypothetical protein A9F13_09g01232 [Clavispora lusitaniae]QFZ25976.1 hypothetical protein EJF14_11100 [Clavispora lusitaniae]